MVDPKLPTELRLALDWELWVIEQLLFSGKLEDLIATVVAQGVEPSLARARVLEIRRSEGFARLEKRVGEARMAAKLQRLEAELDAHDPSPRQVAIREDIDPATLLTEHWIRSRPVLLTHAARSMRAVQDWSLTELARRFPTLEIEVNVDRLKATRSSDTETRARRMTLPEFVARAEAERGNDFYVVSRNGLLARPELASLWADLAPLPAFLREVQPPRGVSLWIGPAGTVTPPHFDPHNVLLVQVQGRKRIRLAPRVRPALHTELNGYYLASSLDDVFAPERIETVILEAGQALFVPVAWFHEVTALDPSITLSFVRFAWPNHFHWLGPPGSDDVD
jgi:ribosomal protein L16 Arg81 hydroxylase